MKRINNIFDSMFSLESLRVAADDACRNRKDEHEVDDFEANKESNLVNLHNQLMEEMYRSSEYRMFKLKENGKIRDIADAPLYPDRIVQWAITNALEPILNKRLIHQTYASIQGRGVKTAMAEINKGRQHTKISYCLKADVKKFFASIDKGRLKQRMRDLIKDKKALAVIDEVIDGYPGPGLPLGNRTSSMFANQFLSPIDHHFKNDRKCHCYVRYMDDILILGNSKKWLHTIRKEMEEMMNDIGLKMKGNWQIVPLSTGVTFLGYRVFKDHTLVKRQTKIRILRAGRDMKAWLDAEGGLTVHMRSVLASYHGFLLICDSYGLRKKAFGPVYDIIGWPKVMKAIP